MLDADDVGMANSSDSSRASGTSTSARTAKWHGTTWEQDWMNRDWDRAGVSGEGT
jgi:hypothetical protein